MNFAWIDAGNDSPWQKLQVNGINGEFYPVSDLPAVVRRRLEDSRGRKHAGGLYAAWNWIDGDGAEFAEYVDVRLRQIIVGISPTVSYPKVSLDHEGHEPDTILDMLARWRQLQPNRDTSWTFEAMQGGWMSPGFVSEVLKAKVRLVPQCYWGSQGRIDGVYDALTVARDLTKRGYPDSLISPFYDAAALPRGWDGFCFTSGRLP